MALTCQQIVAQATQIARAPAYIAQAGQLFNAILQELAQDYDFDIIRGKATILLTAGSGPYPLPTDYLRADFNDVFYTVSGVPYTLIPMDLADYDQLVQQAGLAGYPEAYATDLSTTPFNMYVWPPSSGAYPLTIRYRKQMPDVATPETSATVPWFPNTNYMITRLAGELMRLTDDERMEQFLGEGPAGAEGILRKYLKLKDDHSDRTKQVKLDRRSFGNRNSTLPNTKLIGW